MSLCDKFRKILTPIRFLRSPTVEDSVFGTMRYRNDCLEGSSVEFAEQEPMVDVAVVSSSSLLLEPAKEAYLKLKLCYFSLKPAIARMLREFYESEDIWFRLRLTRVFIDTNKVGSVPCIELSYSPDWDPDRNLIVRLENWQPTVARLVG